MTIGGILFLVAMIVALFAFVYLIVLSAGNWGVLHTLLLCCLFLECWCFMVFAAGVMRKRVGALAEYAKYKDEAEKLEADIQKLTWGDPHAVSEELDSIVAAKSELRRATMDRGRVWRRASLIDQPENDVRLQLAIATAAPAAAGGTVPAAGDALLPATPAAPAATGTPAAGTPAAAAATPAAQPAPATTPATSAPTLQTSMVDMVVYGFAEASTPPGVDPAADKKQPIPEFYLGEFKVIENQAGQVLLRPTAPLEPSQVAYIKDGRANSWTLYELLPLDSHQAFAAPGSKPTAGAMFGRMDEETIKRLFANVPEENSRQQKAIARYLRDGQRATDDDPADSVWQRIELLKEYETDVDSQSDANATIGGYFDSTGRSIDVRMKRGEGGRVKLPAGKTLVVTQAAARDLIEKGIAKLIEPVFVRPLVAYEEAFNKLSIRRQSVTDNIAICERDTSVLAKANELEQAMIAESQIEKQMLSDDLAMYQKEQAVVKSALTEMEAKLQQTKTQLSQLYRAIQARHAMITGG